MKPKTWQEAFEHLRLIISDGFNTVFHEFDKVNTRIDKLEVRMDNIEKRMDKIEKRMDVIEDDVKDIRAILKKNNICFSLC